MAELGKITGKSYYSSMPAIELEAGDIWTGLPSFGHLRRQSIGGVVITPACDLSNRKVETVTYLPVIPVTDYLTSRGFAIEMVRAVRTQASVAGIADLSAWGTRGIELPSASDISKTLSEAEKIAHGKGSEKMRAAATRVCSAARVLLAVRGKGSPDVSAVFGAMGAKEKARCLSDLCRNSHSTDIHFLPSDGKVGPSSSMEVHSVVLFRYPMALPVDLLTAANDVSLKDWAAAVDSLSVELPVCSAARGFRPVKVATLRPQYLPDLLARFVALHVRMGSPDFSSETLDAFVGEIGGAS